MFEEYLYHIEVEDIDNDQFYYSLGVKPNGMYVDSIGTIRWTPEEGVPVSFGTGAASTSSVETLAGSDSTSLSDSSGDSIDSPDACFVTGATS